MNLQARIKFTRTEDHVVIVVGEPRSLDDLPLGDVLHRLMEAEEYLSRLLGLTVKIETDVI